MTVRRPTKADLADAVNRRVPDIIAPGLKVLFVGINPGIYTAAVGHHFAHPSNRFWRALYESGLTPELLTAFDNEKLLQYGYGITNLVDRPTPRASDLAREELIEGWQRLEGKVRRYAPRWLAVCGLGAYQTVADRAAVIGEQPLRIDATGIWVLPNPSGLNASFTPKRMAEAFAELRARIA